MSRKGAILYWDLCFEGVQWKFKLSCWRAKEKYDRLRRQSQGQWREVSTALWNIIKRDCLVKVCNRRDQTLKTGAGERTRHRKEIQRKLVRLIFFQPFLRTAARVTWQTQGNHWWPWTKIISKKKIRVVKNQAIIFSYDLSQPNSYVWVTSIRKWIPA